MYLCMCECVCVRVCVPVKYLLPCGCGCLSMSYVTLYFSEAGSLPKLGSCAFLSSRKPTNPRGPSVSAGLRAGVKSTCWMPGLFTGGGDLNFGPHDCAASVLSGLGISPPLLLQRGHIGTDNNGE